jgi:hypothetical protein
VTEVAAPASSGASPNGFAGLPPLGQYIAYTLFGHALAVAAELRLADLLADGPRSIDDLAVATATHAPSLARLMRALVSIDVLRETPDGAVELMPLGATLRTFIGDWFREAFSEQSRRARGDLLESVRTGKPAIDRLYGKSVFESWQSDPKKLAQTNEAFRASAAIFGETLTDTYDLSRAACIVDVGGNVGGLLSTILRKHRAARGIVFDLPNVVIGAEPVLAGAGVLDRCAIEGGDFFTSVPAGGDVYVLQRVVHDWDDAQASAILRACRASIQTDGVLLVIETVLPERLEANSAARTKSFWDLNMLLVSQGGHERTEEQFRSLLNSAEFTLKRVIPITPAFSVIEALPM